MRNFLFWIFAGIAIGLAILAITSCTSAPRSVHTGTAPASYATDHPARVPLLKPGCGR